MCRFNLILLALLLLPISVQAAAPSRTYSYVAHTTIDPTQNNTNENSLYSYLQAGVDTYSSGSITNDAISSIAAISYSKLNLLGSIVNADISNSAAIGYSKLNLTGAILNADLAGSISDTKLSQITTASKVSGTAITGLASLPAGAGVIPTANLPTLNPHGVQVFTSSNTFTAPTSITKVYITAIASGGGGGAGTAGAGGGGGGASGQAIINYPYTVVPGNNYTITINAGGAGGASDGAIGVDGGTTVFDAITLTGGLAGSGISPYTGATGTTLAGNNGSSTLPGAASVFGMGSNAGGNGSSGAGNRGGGSGGGSAFGAGAIGGVVGSGNGGSAVANSGAGGGGGGSANGGANWGVGGTGGSGICIVQY